MLSMDRGYAQLVIQIHLEIFIMPDSDHLITDYAGYQLRYQEATFLNGFEEVLVDGPEECMVCKMQLIFITN